ncbi:MAG: hypothetical protein U0T81_06725 [Saprospiraceae bacterium]
MSRVIALCLVIVWLSNSLLAGGRELPGVEVRDVKYQVIDTVPYKNRPGSNPERDKKIPLTLKIPNQLKKILNMTQLPASTF